jgi:hypothetical protein
MAKKRQADVAARPRRPELARRSARAATAERLQRLRLAEGPGGVDRLLLATLRLVIPPGVWTGSFSTSHPNVRMEALNRTEVSPDVSVSDYWISGQPPGCWAREIGGFSDVLRVDSLTEVGGGCLYRVTYQNPQVVYLYRRLRIPIQFPLRIQAGTITWEVVARASEFQEIMEYMRSRDRDLRVLSIRRRPLRAHLPMLTVTQEQLLRDAMAAGYFAVPRGITLTDLAKKLDRSKSSISESIAIIERKLLETVLGSATASA